MRALLVPFAWIWMSQSCHAFHWQVPTRLRTIQQASHSFLGFRLSAKKGDKATKQKRSATATPRRGFGSSSKSTASKEVADDYSIFPALEPNVLQTLVPAQQPDHVGELPNDIYQRLEQIYGFEDFNYPSSTTIVDDAPGSVADLLSTMADNSLVDVRSNNRDAGSELVSSLGDLLLGSDQSSESLIHPLATATSSNLDDISSSLNLLPAFQNLSVLHTDPLVISIRDFFTHEECDRYVAMVRTNNVLESRSPTVGKDRFSKSQRTSTTWYNDYKDVPELMAKACRLLGLSTIHHFEEPQTVRYRGTEKFTWHLDALGPAENQAALGGQRTATLLVYLSELQETEGGATMFRDLGKVGGFLKVRPVKGSALLFFPAAGGIPDTPYDIRTLHAGEAVAESAENDKWISQLWLRSGVYKPSMGKHSSATEAIANYCSTNQG